MGMQYRIVYKKGSENRVADALSRRPHPDSEINAISRSQPVWMMQIIDAYQQDASAVVLLQRLAVATEPNDPFTLTDGIIRKRAEFGFQPTQSYKLVLCKNSMLLQWEVIRAYQ